MSILKQDEQDAFAQHRWLVVTYPSEKYESQVGSLFPIYGK